LRAPATIPLAAGSLTYGPSKAALEALSAIMAEDLDGTSMITDETGFERAAMIQPDVMAPLLLRLVSEAAGNVTGGRSLRIR
jgi:hypothetical protein